MNISEFSKEAPQMMQDRGFVPVPPDCSVSRIGTDNRMMATACSLLGCLSTQQMTVKDSRGKKLSCSLVSTNLDDFPENKIPPPPVLMSGNYIAKFETNYFGSEVTPTPFNF